MASSRIFLAVGDLIPRLVRFPVSNNPLFKTRRKASLWKQLPNGEVSVGAAAEGVGRTAKPESWQEDRKCLSPKS